MWREILKALKEWLSGLGDKLPISMRTTSIDSAEVVKDNSGGTSDLVEPLFSDSTPSESVVVKRVSSGTGDSTDIYIGGKNNQYFPLSVGEALRLSIDDLSKVYVRVPPGVIAKLYVIWES